MTLHEGVAQFFGGVFLANFAPHFVAGVSGRQFPTPFAKPPFRGLSSPITNVIYGLLNLGVAYVLLEIVGAVELGRAPDFAVAAAGFGLWSLFVARSVTKLQRAAAESAPR